jgi:hypothetical protein
MNRKNGGAVVGVVFIILGGLFFLNTINVIDFTLGTLFGKFWPTLFLIVPGISFHYSFFKGNRNDPGLLVPGGLLTVLGLAFQFNMLFGAWSITWPLYIFAVAFGLFELYWFGSRDRGLLIPISILGGVSVISFLSHSLRVIMHYNTTRILIPVGLIIVGLVVLFKDRIGRDRF